MGSVGTELDKVKDIIMERLKAFRYEAEEIRISKHVIPEIEPLPAKSSRKEYDRVNSLIIAGNHAREKSRNNSVLALGVAAILSKNRTENPDEKPPYKPRRAYIINSLKRPEEVERLREIYSEGFFLIGVYSDRERRFKYLTEDKGMAKAEADDLIERDADEHLEFGQRTSDTFHLSDFFVHFDEHSDKIKKSIWRVLDIIFGHPNITPTFDEFAMFMAFSASLRSADLSRQVGAVIAKNNEIITMGANDCPKYGGGLYWPELDNNTMEIRDIPKGRDYTLGHDSNVIEKNKIIYDILSQSELEGSDKERLRLALKKSKIRDITEYGRVVHAEMEAILSCSRNNVSSKESTLYCTTFPCHNCAKHIIAAGIKRVVYVEPYPKSKAAEFHGESISLGFTTDKNTVHFEPFVGVGPRRFFDLFSMRLGSGRPIERKKDDGSNVPWKKEDANLRIQMRPVSYIEKETLASILFKNSKDGELGVES